MVFITVLHHKDHVAAFSKPLVGKAAARGKTTAVEAHDTRTGSKKFGKSIHGNRGLDVGRGR